MVKTEWGRFRHHDYNSVTPHLTRINDKINRLRLRWVVCRMCYKEKKYMGNNKVKQFKDIVESMAQLYEKKNADYGDSFGVSVKKYGLISALTRISDKFNRLEKLVLKQDRQVDDERLEDTLLDLASYCVMTVIELADREDK